MVSYVEMNYSRHFSTKNGYLEERYCFLVIILGDREGLCWLAKRVTYGPELDNVYDRTCLEERYASRGVSEVCPSYV